MLTVPIQQTPDTLADVAGGFPGGFTEIPAVYVGLDRNRPQRFTHGRIPDKIISLRLNEPRISGSQEDDNWSFLAQRHFVEGTTNIFARTHVRFAVRAESGQPGLLIFTSMSEREMGSPDSRVKFLAIGSFDLSQPIAHFLPQQVRDRYLGPTDDALSKLIAAAYTDGFVHTQLSFDGVAENYRFSKESLDVELFTTPHIYMPTEQFWERALEGNVVGGNGNVISLDHTHREKTRKELSTTPALQEVARGVQNPRHELMISPGDGHEITELKGKVRALSRSKYSNISIASLGVTMVGDGDSGPLVRTGHSTFDYLGMLKRKEGDTFEAVTEAAYRDTTVENVIRHYEFVRRFTHMDDDLPTYLELMTDRKAAL